MSRKTDEPSDEALFREAMSDTRPLKVTPRVDQRPPAPAPVPRQRERDERAVLDELLDPPDPLDDPVTGEELSHLRGGYQRRFLTRLKRGHYAIGAHLDLHHMNQEAAHAALLDFIDEALSLGIGCVRIVHGKGLRSRNGPVLKQMTNRLLKRHRAVIAFASCRPVDGGTGAVQVLLRSR